MGCVSACFFFRFLSAFCEEASMRVLVRCRMSSVLPLSVEPRTSTFASLMTPGEQENRPDERMRPRARGSGPASEPAGLQVSCLREKGEGTPRSETQKKRRAATGDWATKRPTTPGSLAAWGAACKTTTCTHPRDPDNPNPNPNPNPNRACSYLFLALWTRFGQIFHNVPTA